MADINVSPGRTNDPSYIGNSQGTDRATLQPLAQVPNLETKYVKPDWAENKSAGIAVKGLGDLSESAMKLTDKVIQQKADDTLTDGINKVRDSFGVAAAADQSTGIAEAAGKAGAESTDTLLAGAQPNQPLALNRLGNKIDGLYEAYQQGGLSNSAYYAKMEAEVRRVKQQFPGYNNEIDSMVSTKLGVNPANALRSALQQDVSTLASKVQSMNDKRTAFEHQNAGAITDIYPNYFIDKANGKAPAFPVIEQIVAKRDAENANLDLGMKRLNANKAQGEATTDDAKDTLYQAASMIDRNNVLKFTNSMGIKSIQDMRDYVDSVRAGTRPEPTPDQLQQLTAMATQFDQQGRAQFRQLANKRIGDSTETLASHVKDNSVLQGAEDASVATIKTIFDGLHNKEHGIVADATNFTIASNAQSDKRLLTNVPDAGTVGAIRRQLGDNFLLQVVADAHGMSNIMQMMQKAGWGAIANGQPIQQTLTTMSQDDPTGASSRQHVKDATDMVVHQEKMNDKKMGDNAFKSLYGEGNRTLIDAFNSNPGAQVQVFTDMVSPRVTKAVSKRSAADQTAYANWATDSFQSLFETRADAANGVAGQQGGGSLNAKLQYDPKTAQFEYKGTSWTQSVVPNRSLTELNQGIAAMKEVWKMQGKDPTEALFSMLPTIGVQPGTPIYKAIQDKMAKAE